MRRLLKTPSCDADLYAIWDYIAADNLPAANQFLERLEQRFKLLLASPEIGERRDDMYPGARSVAEGKYIIFYEPTPEGITIHRVFHGARRWEDLKF
jgi:toxin ParE1/3/4